MADMREIILLPIFLAIAAILIGSIFISGVGSLANATQGNACKNCDATTKSLLTNVNVFLVIAIILAVIGIAVASFFKSKK